MHSSSFIFLTSVFLLNLLNSAHALETRHVLIMGDSLSAAYNIEVQSSWPILLQKKIDALDKNIKLINASISGETTFGGKSRINALLKQFKPKIVIIELGGNDGLRGLNMAISQQNISAMVLSSFAHQSEVLLIGVRLPPNLGTRYNEKFQAMYQSLANQHDIHYLPKFLSNVAEHKALMQSDGIHPTAEAQTILAAKVFEALQAMKAF